MSVKTDSQSAFPVISKPQSLPIVDRFGSFKVPFSERRLLLMAVDSLLMLMALGGAFVLWQIMAGIHFDAKHVIDRWYMFPALLGGWWVLARLNDLYDIPSSTEKISSAVRITMVGLMSLVIYQAVFFFIPNNLPRLFFLIYLSFIVPLLILWRWGYATLFKILPLQHRIAIIGHGQRGQSIANLIKKTPKLNYEVFGFLDNTLKRPTVSAESLPVWNQPADLPDLVNQLDIHEIIVAIEHNLDNNLFQWLMECQARGVRVSSLTDLFEKVYHKIPVEHIDPIWALQSMQDRPIFNRSQLALKRVLDIILGTVGLLILTPLLPLIALAIRINSPGRIFYRQVRSGRAGKEFSIIKFRTMTNNAEKNGKAQWASKNDVRITGVGRFLRKTRLDELPQVLNIIRGDMSIVGPRPERPEFVAELQQAIPFYRTRLMVKPGLTGWAQTHYDYGNSVEDALIKLQYDFYYLRYGTFWLDLYIVFRTISVVLRFKGM